jgi:hypothetical protein
VKNNAQPALSNSLPRKKHGRKSENCRKKEAHINSEAVHNILADTLLCKLVIQLEQHHLSAS